MLRSHVFVSAAVVAVLVLGLAVGHRLGAAGTALPVVREQFLRFLDPDAPDLTASAVLVDTPADWMAPTFDDSSWMQATADGGLIDFEGTIVRSMWTAFRDDDDRVAFRKSFRSDIDSAATLLVNVDNDFRAWLNGELVGAEVDGDPWMTRRFELPNLVRAGTNVLAIEGIDLGASARVHCALRGAFGEIGSDGTWKAAVLAISENHILAGSRWAILELPRIDRQSRLSVEIDRVSPGPESSFADLAASRNLNSFTPPILVQQNRLLIQLAARDPDSEILQPGLYRISIDRVE